MRLFSMDPHKAIRGARLKAWIAKHGGAAHCLSATGLDRGTKEFKSRESYLSTCMKDGMGHAAADTWEKRFEPIGMLPGTLTNNLELQPARDEEAVKAPAPAPQPASPGAGPSPLAKLVAELALTLDQMSKEGREAAGQALMTLCRAPDSKKAAMDVFSTLGGGYVETNESQGPFRKQSGA